MVTFLILLFTGFINNSNIFFVLPDSVSPIPEQGYHWKESENLSMLISAAVCVSVCMSICLFASDSMTPAKLWGFEKQKWHPIPRTGFYTTKRKEAGHIKYFSQSIPILSSFLSTVMPCFICSLFPTLSFFSFHKYTYFYTWPFAHS